MPDLVTSRDNERVKYARRLAASGGFRTQEGLFFAEGKRLCTDLLENITPQLVFATQAVYEAEEKLWPLEDRLVLVSDGVAEKLADTKTPQGLVCLFPLPQTSWEALLPRKGLLLCDTLQDPTNVGAVLRSAAAFGYGGAIMAGGADPFSPKALRASMGAALRLPVVTGAEALEAVNRLQAEGVAVYAAAADGQNPQQCSPRAAECGFALVVGNEGAGISLPVLQAANHRVGIPMQGGVESLNAAVAASVLMYVMKNGVFGGQNAAEMPE